MPRVKERIKKDAITKNIIKAAPAKANPGKVRKVCVNVKNVKMSNQNKMNISVKNSNTSEVSPKLKLCAVKLRRTHINSSYVKENLNNNNAETNTKNNNNTLQAQCKTIDGTMPLHNSATKINSISKGKLVSKRMGEKASLESTKISSKSIREKKASNSLEHVVKKIILNEKNVSANTTSKRKCNVNSKPLSTVASTKEAKENNSPISLRCTKRCAVRLQRTPVANKTNTTKQKPQTKNCRVRLQKLINREENQAIEQAELRNNLKISNTTRDLSVTDSYKRDNFFKLSLTRNYLREPENSNKTQKITYKANPPSTNELIKDNIQEVNNCLPRLKHVPRLSLKNTTGQNMKNVSSNTESIQFDHPQDMTIFFEPGRNSTVLDCSLIRENLEEHQTNESSNDKKLDKNNLLRQDVVNKTVNANKDSIHNCRSLVQNLANKSSEIENLLNSLDDDDTEETNEKNKNYEAAHEKSVLSKPKKFFHFRKEDLQVDNSLKAPVKQQGIRKRRKYSTKRSSLKNTNDIYEFLSQSQTSDCNGDKRIDPAADIIKKLIDQGKVRVATNYKGKGKPIFKRKIPNKQMKRIKQTVAKKPRQLKNKIKSVTIAENVIEHPIAEDDHFDEHFANDLDNDNFDVESINHKNGSKKVNNNSKNDQEGTFSRLAKSVLISQAGRSGLQTKNKASHLLKMVKKFISTPKNKQHSSETTLNPDFSPISKTPPRPVTKASPWRVDEDAHLPRLFNFSRSSANLPSYSSDFIPPTPRKEKSKHNEIQVLQQECIVSSDNISLPGIPPQCPLIENEPSVISSFSSNDSNAENIAPHSTVHEGKNENNNIFDSKQFPNPRRALSYRSPLKTINILEVVHLPPFKPTFKPISSKEVNNVTVSDCGFKENIGNLQPVHNVANARNSPKKTYTEGRNNPIDEQDLFGFEENIAHDSLQDIHNVTEFEKSHQLPCTEEGNKSIEQDLFGFEENIGLDSLRDVHNVKDFGKSHQYTCTEESNEKDLFGFGEYVDHNTLQDVHNVANVGKSSQKTYAEEGNKSIEQDLFGFGENVGHDSLGDVQNVDDRKSPQQSCIVKDISLPIQDLFGFEDFLSQTNVFSEEYSSTNDDNNSNTTPNVTIHDKLHDLRKLKPKDNELLKEKLNCCVVQNMPLFGKEPNILGSDGKRQRNIKEMLCSTMIHQQPSTSKEALKDLRKRNIEENCDLSELFKDPDPEITFNENEAHRTYVRPYKRKRRLNDKNLVIVLESDDSGDEEKFKDQQTQNRSDEADTSYENAPKKKRNRKAPKVNHELNEFVEEFNEMCREVESYKLIVEKST